MRVYGVDCATRRIAVACPEVELVWSIDLDSGPGTAARRRQFRSEFEWGIELGERVNSMLDDFYRPARPRVSESIFVMERPFVGSRVLNIRTAIGQSLSAAAALATLPGRVVMLNSPSLWKKALCDNGSASKADVQTWIEQRHPALAEACHGVEDRFDAVGIALGCAALARAGDL